MTYRHSSRFRSKKRRASMLPGDHCLPLVRDDGTLRYDVDPQPGMRVSADTMFHRRPGGSKQRPGIPKSNPFCLVTTASRMLGLQLEEAACRQFAAPRTRSPVIELTSFGLVVAWWIMYHAREPVLASCVGCSDWPEQITPTRALSPQIIASTERTRRAVSPLP